MNIEYFIARRVSLGEEAKRYMSRSIVRFASISIALGLAAMIITISVVTGFKNKISYKVFGFGSHIQIVNFDSNSSYETVPIVKNDAIAKGVGEMPDVQHVQVFATKPGIIKTFSENQGVILKGIGKDFDWKFFSDNLVAGKTFKIGDTITNSILISKYLASLLKLKPDDEIAMYFIQDPPRVRRLKISGIYETGLEEFDKIFIIGDIRHIQKLNKWRSNEITGYEVALTSFDKIDDLTTTIRRDIGIKLNPDGSALKVTNIKEKNPQIFDWLNLQNLNVWIILTLMILVAGFNMMSAFLILILERTNMIGLLKALGASNWLIGKIFIYQSFIIILKGLLWGNIMGISICYLQYHFQFIKLDQSSYFLNSVPINLDIIHILMLNIGTTILTLVMLALPSVIISKVSPENTLRFN